MFTRFEAHFRQDYAFSRAALSGSAAHSTNPRSEDVVHFLGGTSFNGGLYRVMTTDTVKCAHAFVAEGFPGFGGRARVFGYDWLGRIFATDSARLEVGSPAIVMFEPGTGQALEIPCNLTTFHDSELVDYSDEALAASFYQQWIANGGAPPKLDQSVGYKKPLFLGGKDVVENLEIANLDVYWALSSQLIRGTRGLLPGTSVTNVDLR